MPYTDDFKGTNMDTRATIDSDLADDELKRIFDLKCDLVTVIDEAKKMHSRGDLNFEYFEAILQEGFDDLLSKDWCKNHTASGSLEWPVKIPSVETIRMFMAKR